MLTYSMSPIGGPPPRGSKSRLAGETDEFKDIERTVRDVICPLVSTKWSRYPDLSTLERHSVGESMEAAERNTLTFF